MTSRTGVGDGAGERSGRVADGGWGPLLGAFRARFAGEPRVYRAPGRVNLIGEHTDYNEGFVLPVAIDLGVLALAAPRDDRTLRVFATAFDELATFSLDEAPRIGPAHWSSYPRGVAAVLERSGRRLVGADLLIHGDVPPGAGLGSSAALEVATAWALLDLCGEEPEPREVARACQRAENEFAGTRCGIMDQLVSCLGRAGHALRIDCRSLETQAVELPAGASLLVCHSGVGHAHASGTYNRRRAECEEARHLLAAVRPGISALRDVGPEDLERHAALLPETLYRRCRHVVGENARVLAAAAALGRGDLESVAALLAQSHASLRDDYEVSCAELDALVAAAEGLPGVFGSRMTGGGFGGCTVSLVAAPTAGDVAAEVAARFAAEYGRRPWMRVCTASDGAERLR